MGVRSEGNGHGNNWKLLIGLSVLCAVVVFLGGFLHRRALDSAIADRQAKSVAFVNTKVATAAKRADLSAPMKGAEATAFTKQLDVPAGTDLRLFSNAGVPLYASPGLAPFPADTEGIQTAAAGDQGRVIDGSDLRVYTPVDGKGAKPVAIAAVVSNYTQLRHDAAGPLDAVRLPVVGLGIVLLIAGLLLMLQATKGGAPATAPAASGKARKTSSAKVASSSSKGRVTGFDPVPVTVGRPFEPLDEEPAEAVAPAAEEAPAAEPQSAAEGKTFFGLRLGTKKKDGAAREEEVVPAEAAAPAPPKAKRSLFARKDASVDAPADVEPQNDKAASALDREVAIRQALEDQLEQLRTRIQMQDVENANAAKELMAQLEAANRRADEAEARANDTGAPAAPAAAPSPASPAAPDDATVRLQELEREVAVARSATADAVSRAEALQRQLDQTQAAPPAPAVDPAAEVKVAEAMAQLTDAQQRATAAEQRASAAEQRAASVESVRDELEVRVAQLGTKAGDLEQRATELEMSLNEANAGGDAVRAEIATLTAALAAANARVTELESTPQAPAHHEDDQAEIARLRGELAEHMERAKAAEDQVASLEAELLAAQRGVPALEDDASSIDEESWRPEAEVSGPEQAPVEEVSVASRFALDQDEVSTEVDDRAPAVDPLNTEDGSPTPVTSSIDVMEPPAHEPEVHEPEVHEPQGHEPEAHENSPRALQASAISGSDESEQAAVVDPYEVSTSSDAWGGSQPTIRDEHPDESPAAEQPETSERQATRDAVEPARVDISEEDPTEHDEQVTAPVEAEAERQQPVVADPSPSAAPELATAVEWHAPSAASAGAATSSASNGNGIPPAPSDEARYDDIWTAAFAPPEPKVAQNTDLQPVDAHAEPNQSPPNGAAPEPITPQLDDLATEREAAAGGVSPDDQPSRPEDEISAEDDMWSLRARLADAALRKQLPHEID